MSSGASNINSYERSGFFIQGIREKKQDFGLPSLNKLTDPPIAFIIFLAVTDENIVFEAWNYTGHESSIYFIIKVKP
jgi:hypothetical protein